MTKPAWGAAVFGASSGMDLYEEILVPRMFTPCAASLASLLQLMPGERVIDIATGPGTVARIAAAHVGAGGNVTACDPSPAMLDIARAKPVDVSAAPIAYVECTAAPLDAPNGSFDVAMCQQGLQFFPDRGAAMTEMHRVLRPGGRVGVSVWADVERTPPFAAVVHGLREVGGDELADNYLRGPYGFTDADVLATVVTGAGFADVDIVADEVPVTYEGGAVQLLQSLAFTPVAGALAEFSEADRSHLVDVVTDRLRDISDGMVVRSVATTNVALGHKP